MSLYSNNGEYRESVRIKDRSISTITVRAKPGNQSKGLMNINGTVFPCALGSGGIRAIKRESDGGTPLASMRILGGYYRRDHIAPRGSRLKMSPISDTLGWCEVPADRNYNRPVSIPYGASHERMRRGDNLYDYCLVLDWNIAPRKRNCGSAIFFHLARPGFTPTQGCVAVTAKVMARLLPKLSNRTVLKVTR